MATAAQLAADLSDAQHRTGPQPPNGKTASSGNAIKHGLSSPFTVLGHENQDEFNELLDCLISQHQPPWRTMS